MKRFIKNMLFVTIMAVLCMIVAANVSAAKYNGDCSAEDDFSNVEWNYENGVLSFDGIGYMKDFSTSDLPPWYEFRNEIIKVTFGDNIESIGKSAFMLCSNLKDLYIPAELNVIGEGFISGSGVERVTFESGNRDLLLWDSVFYNAKNLKSVEGISERVYHINADAFEDSSLDIVNYGVDFYYDDILMKVDVSKIDLNKYVVADGTKVIAEDAFSENISSRGVEVVLPESLEVFGHVSYIYNIFCDRIPSSVKKLPAFFNAHFYEYTERTKEKIEEWKQAGNNFPYDVEEIYDKNIFFQDIISGKINYKDIENMLEYVYTMDNWYLACYSKGHLTSLVDIPVYDDLHEYEEGIVGLIDTSLLYSLIGKNGVILPESLKQLSIDSPVKIPKEYLEYIREEFPDLFNEMPSVTFLNPECEIFDHIETISTIYTICGYPGSTAEAYAKKYNRNFVDITNCKHDKTCQRGYWDVGCEYVGYSGDTHCQYCGEFISKGNFRKQQGMISKLGKS